MTDGSLSNASFTPRATSWIATLQSRLDDEIAKNAAHRLYEAEARQRMAKTLADAVGDAVAPRLQELQRRVGEFEQRSMGTAPDVAQ